jgi:hypothetical protein
MAQATIIMHHLLRCLLALCLLGVAAGFVPVSQAAPPATALERSVKAAFLYKFLAYTEYPANAFSDPNAPVVIGVAGSEEMTAELARVVNGRTVFGRAVAVRSVREGDPLNGMHLLFVGGGDLARAMRMTRAAQQLPVLVVTEADSSPVPGSIINFRVVDDRVRFDVWLDAAERNNVKLSSRLLTVAHQVHKGAN